MKMPVIFFLEFTRARFRVVDILPRSGGPQTHTDNILIIYTVFKKIFGANRICQNNESRNAR